MRFPFRVPLAKAAVARAFTLIELLVVISIIAILAGLLLPVANRVIENARKVTAKSALVTVVNAVKNYQAEYGSYPVVPPAGAATAKDTTFDTDASTPAGSNGQLCFVLRALNSSTTAGVTSTDASYTALNARHIVYLEYKDAKNPLVPKDGFVAQPSGTSSGTAKDLNGKPLKVGDLIDPWGDMYGFRLDTGYSDKVVDPYLTPSGSTTGAGDQDDDANTADNTLVHTTVIGWSLGKDHVMGTTANFNTSGNVASWK